MTGVDPIARNILVADDEASMRTLVAHVLRREGYSVTLARDGFEAFELLERESFDLVLLDLWMPRMTGFEVLARLKTLGSAPRAIVMTGDNTPVTVMNAIREHAWQYIAKPFEMTDLVSLVERALSSDSSAAPIEVLSATRDWIELLVPCDRTAAERVHDVLMQLETELPSDVRESVSTVFRELLANAVEWGGGLDPERKVRIALLRCQRALIYRITDPGAGFNLEDLQHAAVHNPPHNPARHVAVREGIGMRPGGLGLLMAKEIADELIYNETRNEVVFMKYL